MGIRPEYLAPAGQVAAPAGQVAAPGWPLAQPGIPPIGSVAAQVTLPQAITLDGPAMNTQLKNAMDTVLAGQIAQVTQAIASKRAQAEQMILEVANSDVITRRLNAELAVPAAALAAANGNVNAHNAAPVPADAVALAAHIAEGQRLAAVAAAAQRAVNVCDEKIEAQRQAHAAKLAAQRDLAASIALLTNAGGGAAAGIAERLNVLLAAYNDLSLAFSTLPQ